MTRFAALSTLLWVLNLTTPSLTLTPYPSCPGDWIVSRVGTRACLPPVTDCLCYAPPVFLELVAIDIQSKCSSPPNALNVTWATLAANCAELHRTPSMSSAQFLAAGLYPASDTLVEPSTTYDYSTVPGVTKTQGKILTGDSFSAITSGVTDVPGPGPTGRVPSTGIGPVPFTATGSSTMSAIATASKASSGVGGEPLFDRGRVASCFTGCLVFVYAGLNALF